LNWNGTLTSDLSPDRSPTEARDTITAASASGECP
jgi:hypothetical protein